MATFLYTGMRRGELLLNGLILILKIKPLKLVNRYITIQKVTPKKQ